MALLDLVKDLEKKTTEAKTRLASGIAFLKDAKKVQDAGLHDKKKMSGFISNVDVVLGRAKEARDKILQSKDYKAITNAKDPVKVKFTSVNDILIKQVQADFAKLRDTATKIEAVKAPAAPAATAKPTPTPALTKPKPVTSLAEWSKLMADKVFGPKILKYSKSSMNDETLKFLSMMKQNKKDKNTYELFIKKGSKEQANIAETLRKQFEAIAASAEPDWSKAPWDAATQEVIRLFNGNIIRDMPV